MDLFVRAKASDRDNYSLLKRCIEFGWDGLAWSQTILGKNGVRSTVAPKKLVDLTPADMTAALGLRAMVVDPSEQLQFRQYNRLHMVVDDVADAQVLSAGNEQFKAFDILSAQPGNGQVFAYLCKTADVDIISIDFSHRVSFPLAKKLIDAAVKRGIHFEIQYAPALGASSRKDLFSGTKNIVKFLRGRHLVISSGTDSPSAVRGPLDVMNIGSIMALSAEQARSSVTSNTEAVLAHAESRRNKYLPIRVLSQASYEEACAKLASGLVKRSAPLTGTGGAGSRQSKRRRGRADDDSSGSDESASEQEEEAEGGDDGFMRL